MNPQENEEMPDELFGVAIPKQVERESEFGYLLIASTYDLKKYDSLYEGSAKTRPELLVIHGILSFLTNHVFNSFQGAISQHGLVKYHISEKDSKNKLIADGINYSSDLAKILAVIANAQKDKKILIYTLFERWRKALYLEEESEESHVHNDEAVLAYVHVLEVLSDEYKGNLDTRNKQEKERMIREIFDLARTDSMVNRKKVKGLINEVGGLFITLKSKVFQMLMDLDMYNPKTVEIVNRYVDHRNAIAHGRKDIYQDKVVFPLKPFFSLIKDIDEDIEVIKTLSARLIAKHLDLQVWEKEWELMQLLEYTPFHIVKSFIDNRQYLQLSGRNFLDGVAGGITPNTIGYYYLKGRIPFSALELSLKDVIVSTELNRTDYAVLLLSAIPLADSKFEELSKKAKEIIKKVYVNDWGHYSNPRDILKDFEYHRLTLTWYEEWLIKGKEL